MRYKSRYCQISPKSTESRLDLGLMTVVHSLIVTPRARLERPFAHHVLRRLVDADVDAAYVFADKPEQEHDHAADKEQGGEHAGVAHGDFGEHELLIDHEKACGEPDHGAEEAEVGGGTQRFHGERGEAVDPEPDEASERVARFAFDAATVTDGDVSQVLGRTEYKPAYVGEGVGVAHDFIDDELAHDEEARCAKRLGLADDVLGHLLVDPAAQAAEQVLLGVLVVAVHHVVAFFQLVDQLERFAGGGLAVVIEAYHIVAGSLCVTGHQGAVLAEVFRKADALDVGVCGGEAFDGLPHIVGTAVVHQHDFVVGAGASRHGFADFLYHGSDGVFAAVAGDYERKLHTFSHLLLCAERAAACIMARPSSEVRMPQTYWLVKFPVSKYCLRQSAISL